VCATDSDIELGLDEKKKARRSGRRNAGDALHVFGRGTRSIERVSARTVAPRLRGSRPLKSETLCIARGASQDAERDDSYVADIPKPSLVPTESDIRPVARVSRPRRKKKKRLPPRHVPNTGVAARVGRVRPQACAARITVRTKRVAANCAPGIVEPSFASDKSDDRLHYTARSQNQWHCRKFRVPSLTIGLHRAHFVLEMKRVTNSTPPRFPSYRARVTASHNQLAPHTSHPSVERR
jgi:hypothetical protein